MKTVLVTGGAGFIGSSLIDRLSIDSGFRIVAVDNLLTGDTCKLSVNSHVKFIKCDVNDYRDIAAVMTGYRFDYVFHYAAVVGVKRTTSNPISVLKDIDGIRNVLDLSKNTGVKRVFFSSSSEVYGEPVELPQHEETTPLNSRLPYAVVKNVGEAFCKSYNKEFGLDYTIFRFFNTYGPKQSSDFVISKFIRAALKNEPITIFGDGKQTRTFCFIDDNVDCTFKIFEEERFVNDVVNIGSESDVSIHRLAQLIIELTNSKSEIVFLPPLKEGDMTRRQPDSTKMRSILNRNLIKLEDGIRMILKSEMHFLKY